MELPVPPYPPEPRHVPPELGTKPMGSLASRLSATGFHLAGVSLFAGSPIVFALCGIACLVAEDIHIIVRLAGFIVSTTLALVFCKSLLPRRLPAHPSCLALSDEDEPIAYAFVTRVAKELGCRAPRKLWMGSGMELGLAGQRSLLDLVWPRRPELVIGLWLWQNLTLSEFQAVVARTLATGSHNRFRFTLNELLRAFLIGHDFLDAMAEGERPLAGLARLAVGVHSAATYPQRACGRLLLRLGLRDEDAFMADLASVRLAGSVEQRPVDRERCDSSAR